MDNDLSISAIRARELLVAGSEAFSRGEYREAYRLARQARHHIDNLGDPSFLNELSLALLGKSARETGQYGEALESLKRARDAVRARVGANSAEYRTLTTDLAILHRLMGEFAAAESMYLEALRAARSEGGAHNVAVALDNLAVYFLDRGNRAAARIYVQQALTELEPEAQDFPVDLAQIHLNWAEIDRGRGDLDGAHDHASQALGIFERALPPQHPLVANCVNTLGLIAFERGDLESAAHLLSDGLRLRAAALGDHPLVADSLYNLGNVMGRLGEFEEASRLKRRALAIRFEHLGSRHPAVGQVLQSLAVDAVRQGNPEEAGQFLQKALEILRGSKVYGHHLQIISCLSTLGVALAMMGRTRESLAVMIDMSQAEDVALEEVFSTSSDRQRLAHLESLRGTYEIFLSLVLTCFSEDTGAVRAAFDLTLRRKGITADALALSRRLSAADPGHRRLREVVSAISAVTAGASPGARESLEALIAEREDLENKIAQRLTSELRSRLAGAQAPNITAALPAGSVLVEIVRTHIFDFSHTPRSRRWHPARYIAFTLQAFNDGEELALADLGGADDIDDLCDGFLTWAGSQSGAGCSGMITETPIDDAGDQLRGVIIKAAEGTGTTPPARAADGHLLTSTLLDPIRRWIDRASHIILSPDGELNRLPFGILPLQGGKHAIDRYSFSYVTVGRDVAARAGSSSPSSSPLVVADPDFDLDGPREGRPFRPVHDTADEGRDVAAILGVMPLTGTEATEAAVMRAMSPRVLHIATHGFFLGTSRTDPPDPGGPPRAAPTVWSDPMHLSGLVLAGANTWIRHLPVRGDAGDGILLAADVSLLDLGSTELVVLSACDTGVGEAHVGEGVFGLRRAFAVAGADTLVMSLWKVPGVATRELMVRFYSNLRDGQQGKAEALRRAQLGLKGLPQFNKIRDWGAFICQGDLGPLKFSREF